MVRMRAGVELLFVDVWDDITGALARGRSARQVCDSLAAGVRAIPHGLALPVCGLRWRSPERPTVPWGWTARRESYRDAYLVQPYWLAWTRDAWNARWAPVRLAMRLGLWRVEEGDYYVNGHASAPRWLANAVTCFLTDTDRAPT